MSDEFLYPAALVSAAWLAEHATDPDLLVFECTTYLHPPEAGLDAAYTVVSGRADYEAGHIPGAGFLDLQGELSDSSSPAHLRFTMPEPQALAHALGQRGVGDHTRVVLYSRGAMQWATRVWWMLRAIGFDNAAILDGGWDNWIGEGRPSSTEVPVFAPAVLTAQPRPALFAGLHEVAAGIDDDGVCNLNALTGDLHRGESARYGRPGRIPGSINVPAVSLTDAVNKTLVSPATAKAAFDAAGVRAEQRVICYCGGGIAATMDAFVLHQLGFKDIAIYDASMSEWARDPSLPIETG